MTLSDKVASSNPLTGIPATEKKCKTSSRASFGEKLYGLRHLTRKKKARGKKISLFAFSSTVRFGYSPLSIVHECLGVDVPCVSPCAPVARTHGTFRDIS